MILIPLIIAISFAYFYVALAVSDSFSKFFAKADYMDAIVSAKKVMISTTLRLTVIPTLLATLVLPAIMQGQESAKHNESKIITFDVPNAGKTAGKLNCGANLLTGCYGTTPMANNNAGEIVGMYITDDGVYYGFLRSPEGRVTEFSEPNADTTPGDFNGTYPMSLNSWGAVTGLYQKVDEVLHGFIREPDGGYVEVDDPSAGTGAFQGTWPTSINDNGDIAGFYFDSSNISHGFVRSRHGQFVTIDDPNATDGTMIALEQGLNSRGAVAGWYFAGAVQYGFVGERDGKFDTIEPSASAQFTYVGGINCAGAITGYFGSTFFSVSPEAGWPYHYL